MPFLFSQMKCCVKDICDKRNSGIYLMTDRSASSNPSLLFDGWTDGKIGRTQEMLHSCQSRRGSETDRESLTRFFRKRSILKDLLVREGRVDGIASAKLSGRVAVAADTSAFGIDLQHNREV